MKDNFKYTKDMIEWRRNTVLSKLAKGYSQADIAKELQLHPSTISLDVQYLKEQAQRELRVHLQEKLPFEYARAMTGINDLLRRANEIVDRMTDPKMQLQSISVLANLYVGMMSLATDGGILEQAYRKVQGLQQTQAQKQHQLTNTEKVSISENEAEEDFQDGVEPAHNKPDEQ
ncbi:MAG TPA: helix-turn-helix domain-containing protein [Nitrososphaeraceae archaeon]|nr:helix-turn-helix domain-containing protein [Nitrososphaeraceae archaeon]